MTKKFLSAIMALSMAVCTFTGCSDLDKNGNLKEASSYETVETDDVRYMVRSDFKKLKDSFLDYSYNQDIEFAIEYIHDIDRMTKDAYIDICSEDCKQYDNYSYEVIDCGDYEVITFLFGDEGEKYNSYFMVYQKDDQYSGFSVLAEYPDKESEELVRKLAFEIIESGEFIGEKRTKTSDYECDYFSVSVPDDYTVFSSYNINGEACGTFIEHYYIDMPAKLHAYLRVNASSAIEYKSAEEYLKAEWKAESDEIKKAEILGYDVYCFVKTKGTYKKEYAFEKDGVIYRILLSIDNEDGQEQVEADFEKLFDSIVIK